MALVGSSAPASPHDCPSWWRGCTTWTRRGEHRRSGRADTTLSPCATPWAWSCRTGTSSTTPSGPTSRWRGRA
ncbi:hypothetical protein QJS66_14710 [Kocuria rhizophila]|nr:hypothetical protein QJS66_14710 [Kocuria rhizophila]